MTCYQLWHKQVTLGIPLRAVAPSLAGPAMAGPVFAAGTKILNVEDMHSKHIFKLGGG